MLLEAHLQTLNKPAAKLNSSEFQNSKTNLDEAQSNLKAELTSKKREYQRINWCRTVDQQHKYGLMFKNSNVFFKTIDFATKATERYVNVEVQYERC